MSDLLPLDVSQRVKELPPYVFGRLNTIKIARRRAGEDIIDLGMGNPSDPTPKPIIDKLCEAVQDPRTHGYSVQADGLSNLKKEVSKFYNDEYNVDIDSEEEVICTIGSKEGLSHMLMSLLSPGDVAIVPTPAFPVHIHGVRLAGGSVLSFPLSTDEAFFKNLIQVADNFRPKPKIMIVNFPHNPTTITVELPFFEKLLEICRDQGIFLIHDFAYSQITFDGYRAPSMLEVEGAKEVGVEFTSMSKSFNMAGWRMGFCVGHKQAIDALGQIKGYFDYGMFMPVQIASIIALRHCKNEARKQARVYQARRDVLCEGLERIGWSVPRPKGTMFTWVPIPRNYRHMSSLDFSLLLLEEANVAAAPGEAFGQGGNEFLRMALVENEQRLKQAVRQIGRVLDLD
ncbi:MAG: aminotransferase class I/II-fold pyridoxal phosphate-dependent enzyme [Planctomycetes bacterium]|nr:aminotransferase class I/II-fold pyridoxal phosphate-dependent enzyme [Planctomycetota bacterium]